MNEDIFQATFGRYTGHTKTEEKGHHTDAFQTPQQTAQAFAAAQASKRKTVRNRIRTVFNHRQEEAQPEPWTGETTVVDILAPASVDTSSRDYVVVDGVYHAYLYVTGYGYQTRVQPAWLSTLTDCGEGVSVSFHLCRQPRDKIMPKITQATMLHRSRMRDVDDTRADFEELEGAVESGLYMKEAINRENQDFYFMHTIIEITAEDTDTLRRRVEDVAVYCKSIDLITRKADYKHEQGFLSTLPCLSLDKDLERKSRRNVLTDALAAAFPFSSGGIYDPEGVFIGLDENNELAIVDFFDTSKYPSGNVAIIGMTGAGKTFLLSLIALRLRQQQVPVSIIAPLKGFEFRPACEAVGGNYVKLSASSQDCICFLDIQRHELDPDSGFRENRRDDSVLAAKIEKLIPLFTLLRPDITQQELTLLEGALWRTYKAKGMTRENASLYASDGVTPVEAPTAADLHRELLSQADTAPLATLTEPMLEGTLRCIGQHTNVDLDNPYLVIDISEVSDLQKPVMMYVAMEALAGKIQASRLTRKALICDELSNLIGPSGTALSANFVVELFKTVRGLGGIVIGAAQDTQDYYALDAGQYGRAIMANSQFKVALHMEENEAELLQEYWGLSDAETLYVKRAGRGQALLCAGSDRLCLDVLASELETQLITTDRKELLKQKERRQHERHRPAEA